MQNYEAYLSFLPEELRSRQLRPFHMPLATAAALASGTNIPLTTPVQNVSAFLLIAFAGRAWTAAAPQTAVPGVALTITTQFSSGSNLDSGPLPWNAVVDDAGSPNSRPGGLVIPRLIPGGSTISCTIANYSGVGLNILLGLVGINVYDS